MINTLKYADRAKHIRLQISRNVVDVSKKITHYDNMINTIREKMSMLKGELHHKSTHETKGRYHSNAKGIYIIRW
jgi:hypothetical protein